MSDDHGRTWKPWLVIDKPNTNVQPFHAIYDNPDDSGNLHFGIKYDKTFIHELFIDQVNIISQSSAFKNSSSNFELKNLSIDPRQESESMIALHPNHTFANIVRLFTDALHSHHTLPMDTEAMPYMTELFSADSSIGKSLENIEQNNTTPIREQISDE